MSSCVHFQQIKFRIQTQQQNLQVFLPLDILNLHGELPLININPPTDIESCFRLPINAQDLYPFKKHDALKTLARIRTRSKTVSRRTQPIYYSSYLICQITVNTRQAKIISTNHQKLFSPKLSPPPPKRANIHNINRYPYPIITLTRLYSSPYLYSLTHLCTYTPCTT